MIKRYTTSLGAAAGVTFTLLLLMQILIATNPSPIEETGTVITPVLHQMIVDTPAEPDDDPTPPPPAEPPPARPVTAQPDPGAWSVGPRITTPPITGPTFTIVPNGTATLLVATTPLYPSRLLSRGIEGYVIVRFNVTTEGTVQDVTVLESSHPGFEKAAINAALKMKYKPEVVDGTPRMVRDVMFKFSFDIEDS